MEKILQINYQGRSIRIEETAFSAFEQYENELRQFFEKQEGGDETFADLQYRMGEILEQKMTGNGNPLQLSDINDVIDTIGRPSELQNETEFKENSTATPQPEKKKLYRNKNKGEKIIAGVCSGIANYFAIDPIAVRIAFVLFTIFNIATLFSFNVGILAYIVLWIVLTPMPLKTNLNRKLFRNPKDKVIGGVCSGLAQFFNTETWIVRLLFLTPFLIGVLAGDSYFLPDTFDHIGSFIVSLTFMSYLLLWFIVPLAKSSTDYMLLKGEPINISTIQQAASMDQVSENSRSGISKFLKIMAYIAIGFLLIVLIPVAISIVLAAIASVNLANIILFTSLQKVLAVFVILFFVLLPVIGLLIWFIRRIAGYHKPNRILRLSFIGLNILGWVSLVVLTANLVKEHKTLVKQTEQTPVPTMSDTLWLMPAAPATSFDEDVIFDMNRFNHLVNKTDSTFELKAIHLDYQPTTDSFFSVRIDKSGFGSSKLTANKHINAVTYQSGQQDNRFYLAGYIQVPNDEPYHFQFVKVTVLVPEGKSLIVTESLKKQLDINFRANNGMHIVVNEWENERGDEVIQFDQRGKRIADRTIRFEDEEEKTEQLQEATQLLEDARRDANLKIEEAKRDLELSQQEADRAIREAKRELDISEQEAKRIMNEK